MLADVSIVVKDLVTCDLAMIADQDLAGWVVKDLVTCDFAMIADTESPGVGLCLLT